MPETLDNILGMRFDYLYSGSMAGDMNAKDTMLTEDQLLALPRIGRDDILLAQAEIAFKAGQRSVIERYQKDNPTYWANLEKEWGL